MVFSNPMNMPQRMIWGTIYRKNLYFEGVIRIASHNSTFPENMKIQDLQSDLSVGCVEWVSHSKRFFITILGRFWASSLALLRLRFSAVGMSRWGAPATFGLRLH